MTDAPFAVGDTVKFVRDYSSAKAGDVGMVEHVLDLGGFWLPHEAHRPVCPTWSLSVTVWRTADQVATVLRNGEPAMLELVAPAST